MREFFIGALEKIITVVIILGAIVVLVAGIGAMFGPQGFLRGLVVLIGGALYLLLIGGFGYLGLGIYHNTRRTADAVEQLARR